MSGSLLPLKTYASAGTPLWAAAGAGGGGGGGSIITVSTISGPSISTPVNVGPAGLYVYTNGFADENSGFEVYKGGGNTTNALADFDAGAGGQGAIGLRGYSTIGGNQVIDSLMTMTVDNLRNGTIKLQHEFAGISTMGSIIFAENGTLGLQALPPGSGGAGSGIDMAGNTSTIIFQPQGAVACHSKVPVSTNTTIPQAGTTQNLGAFATTAGHLYDVRLPVRIDAVSQPAAGDWAVITTDSGSAVSLASFDMTQVSTIDNQWETNICGTVLASAGTTTLLALGKVGAGTSTAVTVAAPSLAYIRDLGIPQNQ